MTCLTLVAYLHGRPVCTKAGHIYDQPAKYLQMLEEVRNISKPKHFWVLAAFFFLPSLQHYEYVDRQFTVPTSGIIFVVFAELRNLLSGTGRWRPE